MIVPKGSICFAGLKLTRPSDHAVSSPRRCATKPCAASWKVMAMITGIAQTVARYIALLLTVSISSSRAKISFYQRKANTLASQMRRPKLRRWSVAKRKRPYGLEISHSAGCLFSEGKADLGRVSDAHDPNRTFRFVGLLPLMTQSGSWEPQRRI